MKKVLKRIFPYLNYLSPALDFFIALLAINEDNKYCQILGWVYLIFVGYRFIKANWKNIEGKEFARTYLSDNRVLAIYGKQGAGKTSFSAYLLANNCPTVYSNVPLKLRKKYTNKATTAILSIDEKIPERSGVYIDEANLYYHNLRTASGKDNDNLLGQSIYEQCIRHFTDGCMIYSSTDVERLPKEIRQQFSARLQMLGQRSYMYAPIGSLLLYFIYGLAGIKIRCGMRVWEAQHFERMNEEGYMVELNQETKKNAYAPHIEVFAFNDPFLFEYNDRYMRGLYDVLPATVDDKWTSLDIAPDTVRGLYDSEIIEFMAEKYKKNQKKSEKPLDKTPGDML